MNRLKSFLGSKSAFFYFIFVMCWVILLLAIAPLMLYSDINVIRESGFSVPNIGIELIGVLGLFIGLSLLIPSFRRMYYNLPWLFPFVKILFIDVIIMSFAIMILNYGYEVQNNTRHTIFFILMIVQIILCRAAMCIYFNKKPVRYIEGDVVDE